MSDIVGNFVFWYKITWIISFVLLFFRDDIDKIIAAMAMTFQQDFFKALFHLVTVVVFLPITLPFTLANILNRCM